MARKHPDLIGQRFGRGVVIGIHGRDKYKCVLWELRCDCGENYHSTTGNLRIGHVSSCGCLMRESVSRNVKFATEATRLPRGHAARNEMFASYKKRAVSNGMGFDLTIEEFEELTKRPCVYCGCEPSSTWRGKNGNYVYNGIDRTDPSLGYVYGNITPCCKRCNQGKNDMTESEFISWVCRVYRYTAEIHVEEK